MIFASSSGDHFDCFLAGDVVGSSAVDAARFSDCGCGRRPDGDGLLLAALDPAWLAVLLTLMGKLEPDTLDRVVGEADEERARSSSTSPCLASLGLRRSEISTFEVV
jgi:hypothetical protein